DNLRSTVNVCYDGVPICRTHWVRGSFYHEGFTGHRHITIFSNNWSRSFTMVNNQ
ncbi:hypothetical protein V3C99_003496, partial [Haemonchus contortus]